MAKKPKPEQTYIPKQYWENILSNDFSLSGVGFLGLGDSYNKWLYRARKRLFKKVVSKLIPDVSSKSILDIGCGTGFYVNLWSQRGAAKVTGFDLTTVSPKKLQKEYSHYEFHTSDITEVDQPCKDEQFDVVTAFDVLFHIVDDKKFDNAISNIGKFARTGAYILISDNFPKIEQDAVYCQKSRTAQFYEELLKREGIEVLQIRPVFYFMNAPVDIAGKNAVIGRLVVLCWRVIRKLIRKHDFFGNIIGCFLYCIEGIMLTFVKDSPTTKLMIARKVSQVGTQEECAKRA